MTPAYTPIPTLEVWTTYGADAADGSNAGRREIKPFGRYSLLQWRHFAGRPGWKRSLCKLERALSRLEQELKA
jgi:hypothetical protein